MFYENSSKLQSWNVMSSWRYGWTAVTKCKVALTDDLQLQKCIIVMTIQMITTVHIHASVALTEWGINHSDDGQNDTSRFCIRTLSHRVIHPASILNAILNCHCDLKKEKTYKTPQMSGENVPMECNDSMKIMWCANYTFITKYSHVSSATMTSWTVFCNNRKLSITDKHRAHKTGQCPKQSTGIHLPVVTEKEIGGRKGDSYERVMVNRNITPKQSWTYEGGR